MSGSENCQEIDLQHRNHSHTLTREAEPPKRTTKGGRMVRRRFQYGALFKRGRRTKVWLARWWEDTIGPGGEPRRIRRGQTIGTVADLPTRRAAEQVLMRRLQTVNSGNYRSQRSRSFMEFVQQ